MVVASLNSMTSAYHINKELTKQLFLAEVSQPEATLDLGRAALLIAKSVYSGLDIERYLKLLDSMALAVTDNFPRYEDQPFHLKTIYAINYYLYDQQHFEGNKTAYYDPQNSLLNQVIERRRGIPITLSVLYMEIAQRLGLTLAGVGMPGHFLIKYQISESEEIFIDAFNQGRLLDIKGCEELIASMYQQQVDFNPYFLRSVSKKAILTRMLTNLKGIYMGGGDNAHALSTIDWILIINAHSSIDIRDRGIICFQLGRFAEALYELELYLPQVTDETEKKQLNNYLRRIKSQLAALN